MGTNTTTVTAATKLAMIDDKWAWPRGSAAIRGWRALVRRGLAAETTGICEGCMSHRAGHVVPVFRLGDGVDLECREGERDAGADDRRAQ